MKSFDTRKIMTTKEEKTIMKFVVIWAVDQGIFMY